MPKSLFDSIDEVIDGIAPGPSGKMNAIERDVYEYCALKPCYPSALKDQFSKKYNETELAWAMLRLIDPDNGPPLMLDSNGKLVVTNEGTYKNK